MVCFEVKPKVHLFYRFAHGIFFMEMDNVVCLTNDQAQMERRGSWKEPRDPTVTRVIQEYRRKKTS